MKFQVGDKVTPISKNVYKESLDDSVVWNDAKKNGDNFLFIIGVDEEIRGHHEAVYVCCYDISDTERADFFLESDLTPYEEKPKTEEVKRGSIITTYRPEYKTVHQYMVVQDGKTDMYKLISMHDGVGFKLMAYFDSMKPEYAIDYLRDNLEMEIISIENPKPIKLSAKVTVEIVKEDIK